MRRLVGSKKLVLALFLLGLLGSFVSVFAEYENGDLYDPRSSLHKSGIKTPREFFLPKTPAYDKVDFHEFEDYHKTYYSPYAQLQIKRPIQIGQTVLRDGYYLVKLDIVQPPPPTQGPVVTGPIGVPGQTAKANQPSIYEKLQNMTHFGKKQDDAEDYARRKNFPPLQSDTEASQRPKVSLLIKQEGEIEVTVPVETSHPLEQRIKKGSTAQLVSQPGNPVTPEVLYLKYCVRSICYQTAPLEPGLVQ